MKERGAQSWASLRPLYPEQSILVQGQHSVRTHPFFLLLIGLFCFCVWDNKTKRALWVPSTGLRKAFWIFTKLLAFSGVCKKPSPVSHKEIHWKVCHKGWMERIRGMMSHTDRAVRAGTWTSRYLWIHWYYTQNVMYICTSIMFSGKIL